ncbi:MAG: tetratricopeptide repeat protein [Rhodospirillales bacterium]|nr:tetratricopeptide repeat protein [Rhodospirillales bacterium]MBT4006264.1 tetratricopeptide repeat protein [Rhodospirillales bacterium]MBT5075652.1 tetratricopeptide repeat protein [Rhodospirillales bacterium]MBT5112362.1 tetratricopeptide repeat protein [Rhodospirillales bacterium]MBT5672063.1 tetratricopeptide repeat protein [Rhodospirillales bacterium]
MPISDSDALPPNQSAPSVEAMGEQAATHHGAGHLDQAKEAYGKLLLAYPDHALSHNNLGDVLLALNQPQEALNSYDRALALKPTSAGGHSNRGNALMDLDRVEDALASFDTALSHDPDLVAALINRGNALMALEQYEAAVESCEKALALAPNFPEALHCLGSALLKLMRYEAAVEKLNALVTLAPENTAAKKDLKQACFLLSLSYLYQGNFKEGWPLYEARPKTLELADSDWTKKMSVPQFDGENLDSLAGKNILIQTEQGLGDEIMHASILPDFLAQHKRVTLAVDIRLAGLFQRSFPDCRVCGRRGGIPYGILTSEFDTRILIGSLDRFFRNRAEDFPQRTYLVADPVRRATVRARLDALGPGRKIGVMWRGGVGGAEEGRRSMDLADMTLLLEKGSASSVHWISLNHLESAGEETDQLDKDTGIRVHHWPEITEARDYDETAALISELDAVVSVTGTVLHCAGALGVETHVLVAFYPEWRYAPHQGSKMLWYGSTNLYRQTEQSLDGWPLDEIAKSLGLG